MEKKYGNKYEVACAILEKLEQGGSGGGGGDVALVDGTKFKRSTFTEIPEYYDFSNITDFCEMFYDCDNLTSVPSLDLSNGTNFESMFSECQKLTEVSALNLSNGTNFEKMFFRCKVLIEIPAIDTHNGTNFSYMFYACNNLKTIQQLNLSNGTDFSSMFGTCRSLENISFVGSINNSIAFSGGSLSSQYLRITDESIKSILTAASNTINTNAKTLSFKLSSTRVISDPNGEFAALVGDCTTKGWTITGLTLE